MAAALIEVVGTRLVMQRDAENPSPAPTPPANNVLDLTPYDGAVIPASVSHAVGKCSQGGEDRVDMLLGSQTDAVWHYPNAGVGEMASFAFRPDTGLVGVRIINDDTISQGHRAGHRILAVRWTFPDGSWAVQPLDVSHPGGQEVRFPPVATDDALMTVLSTTEPESPETAANTVAVPHVEFLGHS